MNTILDFITPYIHPLFLLIAENVSKLTATIKAAIAGAFQSTIGKFSPALSSLLGPAVAEILDFIFENASALTPELLVDAENFLITLLKIGIADFTGEWSSSESAAAIHILVDDLKTTGDHLLASVEVAGEKIPDEVSKAFASTIGALPGALLSIFGL